MDFFSFSAQLVKSSLCLGCVSHKTGICPNRRKTETQITVLFCCPFYHTCKHWWSSLKPDLQLGDYFPPEACHFVLLISLILKADHHIVQQFEFCRGIFPYKILFFLF